MGQRANLITVESGEYTVRYDHWCANRLDEILFWGAGYALEFFDAQEQVDNVPLPPDVRDWLQAWTDDNYKPEPRKRKPPASGTVPV